MTNADGAVVTIANDDFDVDENNRTRLSAQQSAEANAIDSEPSPSAKAPEPESDGSSDVESSDCKWPEPSASTSGTDGLSGQRIERQRDGVSCRWRAVWGGSLSMWGVVQ